MHRPTLIKCSPPQCYNRSDASVVILVLPTTVDVASLSHWASTFLYSTTRMVDAARRAGLSAVAEPSLT